MSYTIRGFEVKGLGLHTYCKIVEYGSSLTISFGTRMKQYCLLAAYKTARPDEIYIDSVDNSLDCVHGGQLATLDRGTVRFTKLALYAIHMLLPSVSVIRFQDDSKIKCSNSSSLSLSLPFDYITKYTNTWYEHHFDAKPDSKHYSQQAIDNYHESLSILDDSLIPFDEIIMRVPGINPYEEIYRASSSPRDFIGKLRLHLGKTYCEKAAILLSVYMRALGVFHLPFWQIDVADINTIDDISIKELPHAEAMRKLHGGRHSPQNGRRQTRRRSKKITYIFTHSPDMLVRNIADHMLA